MALEFDDDTETLEAALALIDEWQVEIDALPSSSRVLTPSTDDCDTKSTTTTEDSDSSSSSHPTTTSRRRKLRSEEEDSQILPQRTRREELVFLRRKVNELETMLTTLKTENEGALIKQEQTPNETQLDATWVWQQIAVRQLEHRQTSERENLRLRVQVEEQLKIAKDLMRVLFRAYRDQDHIAQDARHMRSFKRVKVPEDALTEVSEEEQLQRVAELVDESQTCFEMGAFARGLPVFRDVNVLEHANGESTINVDSSWVVPFPVPQVMTAFWMHLMRKTHGSDICIGFEAGERCNRPDDGQELIVTRYESNATASKFAGKFYGRFVARRTHPENNKPGIIIMDMCADPVGFTGMSMEGVRLHQETIMRVVWADQVAGKPVPSSDTGRMALIQMSQRIHVQLAAAETPTRRKRVGALTNFMMYNVEAELNWKQDLLETLLMRSVMPTTFHHNYCTQR